MSQPPVDRPAHVELSIVAPAYNEAENIRTLYRRIRSVLGDSGSWELVLVDDGSVDGTAKAIEEVVFGDPRIRGVILERNYGQTTATSVGVRMARGRLIATLDADLQNDPADIAALVERLHAEGCDAVAGYRVKRHDGWVRRVSSSVAKVVRNRITGDPVRDTGCSLKLFRAEAIRAIPMFEGMHRFTVTLLRYHGFTVIEHPVSHAPRLHGRSKYGIRNRAWRGLKDLLAVRWMRSRVIRPRGHEIESADE